MYRSFGPDIEPEEGQVLLSRKITGGRSVSKINGETCTVSQMKAAAACLLDIHGQHEHQSLLYRDKQLESLDSFSQDTIRPLAEKTAEAYHALRDSRKALEELNMNQEDRAREMAFLEYEIQEIEQAAAPETYEMPSVTIDGTKYMGVIFPSFPSIIFIIQ